MKKLLLALGLLFIVGQKAEAQVPCTGAAVPGMIVGTNGSTCTYAHVDNSGNLSTNATLTGSVTVGSISPNALTSTNLSGTISVTNTFQSIQALTAGRKGCLIQNQSLTDTMWVFFGPIGSATKATAFELDPQHGLAISCAVPGLGVATDQVSITGTSTDAFTANFQ